MSLPYWASPTKNLTHNEPEPIDQKKDNICKNSPKLNSNSLVNSCSICNENRYEREYFEIFDEKIYSLISLFILEGIYLSLIHI